MTELQRDETLNLLKKIINNTLKDTPVDVYLFGSWARQEEKRTSDIDIALLPSGEMPMEKWIELREQIEESPVPYQVDLVDLTKVNHDFNEKIMEEGILWKDCKNVL